ncbi:hypothetical protein [Streptomyces lavendofoliae]|uniref:hypothetical protein n=1 Tax=Streptomyces lavendofoliae TaxID=67314 RepID=UPI00300F225E
MIDGRFDAYCNSGPLTHQSATFGYRHAPSGSWHYTSYWCDDLPQRIHIEGTRRRGEKMEFSVGATSGIANSYQYGSTVTRDIGTD